MMKQYRTSPFSASPHFFRTTGDLVSPTHGFRRLRPICIPSPNEPQRNSNFKQKFPDGSNLSGPPSPFHSFASSTSSAVDIADSRRAFMHGPTMKLGTSLLCLLTCFVRASSAHYGNSVASSLGKFFSILRSRNCSTFFSRVISRDSTVL